MKVAEVMTADPVSVDSSDTLQTAGACMAANDCGSLPVTRDGELCGVITDRDITIRAVAKGSSADQPVSTAMTGDIVTIDRDQDVETAARLMAERQLRRLYVTNDRKLVGVVALADLATQAPRSDAATALQGISR